MAVGFPKAPYWDPCCLASRPIALSLCRAYRTLSGEVVSVIDEMIPLDLLKKWGTLSLQKKRGRIRKTTRGTVQEMAATMGSKLEFCKHNFELYLLACFSYGI